MGQASVDEESDLPSGVVRFLLDGVSASTGFNYILPLSDHDEGVAWRADDNALAQAMVRSTMSSPISARRCACN